MSSTDKVALSIIEDGDNYRVGVNQTQDYSELVSTSEYVLDANGNVKISGFTSVKRNTNLALEQAPAIKFMTNDDFFVGKIFMPATSTDIDSRRIYFEQRTDDDSTHPSESESMAWERYRLPTIATIVTPSAAITSDNASTYQTYYEILTTKAAVTIAQGGTGATNATDARTALGITPVNIGAIPLTGGTNIGSLTADTAAVLNFSNILSTYTTSSQVTINDLLHFRNQSTNDSMGRIYCLYRDSVSSNHALTFLENSFTEEGASTTYYETFSLPAADINRSSNGGFNILTTKNAVTIAQGGTGATTALAARTALGITPSNIGAKSIQTPVVDDSTIPSTDALIFVSSINQNINGEISVVKSVVRTATSESNGIITIGPQSFSGVKTFLNSIITGDIAIKSGRYPSIAAYYNTETTNFRMSGIWTETQNTSNGPAEAPFMAFEMAKMHNREPTGYYQRFRFTRDTSLPTNANTTHSILTSQAFLSCSHAADTILNTSLAAFGSGTQVFQFFRSNRLCVGNAQFYLATDSIGQSTTTWLTVGTMPEKFRPNTGYYGNLINLYTGEVATIQIRTNGDILMYKQATTGTVFYGNFAFALSSYIY